MKLRCDSSFRVVKIEILLNPGDEIEVPDETGTVLVRAYESRLVEITGKTAKKGPSALERANAEAQEAAEEAVQAQEAADAAATAEPPARRPRRKSARRKTAAKRSTAKKAAEASEPEPAPVGAE